MTSHVPETHTAPITRIEFDDGKHVLDEGQLILTANPPQDDTYILCRDGLAVATSEKFAVSASGELSGEFVSTENIDKSLVKRDNTDGCTIN